MSTKKKKIQSAILKINATKNNVFFTLTSLTGDVIFSISCGVLGYRNAKKHTPGAVKTTFEKVKEKMLDLNVSDFEVVFNGYGSSMNEVLIMLHTLHKEAKAYSFVVNRAHNGTTLPRPRSV